jgi:hypothetical protein
MAFNMILKIVYGAYANKVDTLKGSADIGSASFKVLKDLTVKTLKGTGNLIETSVHVPRSIVNER